MCRLLGITANQPTEFRIVLREAPRSLAALSREHPDGWGIAVFDAQLQSWQLDKGVMAAGEDERFHSLAIGSRGELLISHVRQRTVGEKTIANTHPFQRGRWVFAHNGTIKDIEWVQARISPERKAEITGETDSELLFAWLLTCLDEAGVGDRPASTETDRALVMATAAARAHTSFGAFNFLLSDGATTYAHRFGRSMFLLERRPLDAVRPARTSRDGTTYETPWSNGRTAVFVASEHITAEPWVQVDEGLLLRIDRSPAPHWRLVA
ncbi:MAG: class II glutamine amidotransferase [Polyangiaceae bacterium]